MTAPTDIAITPDPAFKSIPATAIARIKRHADSLASAESSHAQLAALFLIHCECKDIEEAVSSDTSDPVPVGLTLDDEV